MDPPVKRKRGRPRINKSKEEFSLDDNSGISVSVEDQRSKPQLNITHSDVEFAELEIPVDQIKVENDSPIALSVKKRKRRKKKRFDIYSHNSQARDSDSDDFDAEFLTDDEGDYVDEKDADEFTPVKRGRKKTKIKEVIIEEKEIDDGINPFVYADLVDGTMLECSVCKGLFTDYVTLNEHMMEHVDNRDLKCFGCSFASNVLPIIIDHKRKCQGAEIYKCFICRTNFPQLDSLFDHINRQIVFKCMVCKFASKTKMSLKEHAAKYHGEPPKKLKCLFKCDVNMKFKKVRGEPKFQCPDCLIRFVEKDCLRSHYNHEHRRKYGCLKCSIICKNRKELHDHITNEHSNVVKFCVICNYRTRIPENLDAHMDYHHRPTIENYPKYECTVCFLQFHIKADMRSHMKEHPNVKLFSCDICGKMLSSEQSLERHQVVHVDARPFACQACDRTFKSKESLTIHGKLHNPPPKNLKCVLCDFRGFSRYIVTKHYQRVHTNVKHLFCRYCEFRCNDETTLRRHVRRHENQEKPHKCPNCVYSCFEKSTLKRHMKSHESDELSYQCSLCTFKSNYRGSLTKHMLTHDPDKVYECEHCSYTSISEKAMMKHAAFHDQERKDVVTVRIGTTEDAPRIEYANPFNYIEFNKRDEEGVAPTNIQIIPSDLKMDLDKSVQIQCVDEATIEVSEIMEEPTIALDSYFNDPMNQMIAEQNPQLIAVKSSISDQIDNIPKQIIYDENGSAKYITYKDGYIYETQPKIEKEETDFNALENNLSTCFLCNMNYFDESNFQDHIKIHPDVFSYCCNICDFRFCNSDDLNEHIKKHNKGKVPCTYCNFTASCQSALAIHIRKHTGERPFRCEHCDKSFGTKGALDKHSLLHTAGNIYKCGMEHCNFQTDDPSRYEKHLFKHENKDPPPIFQCSYCDFNCKTKSALDRHLFKHTGEKQYHCVHCDFKTNDQTSIKRHTWRHTNKNKDIQCQYCDYKCYVPSTLKRHMKTHAGVNTFGCPHCEFRCSFKGTLTKHLKCHTG